jgi:hypothetical protein
MPLRKDTIPPFLGPHLESQRCKEPPILPAQIPLLQRLLHILLSILPLRDLLERIVRDDVLQSLQFERVPRRHYVIVIDHLDEGLDFRSLFDALLAHAAGDFGGIAFNTGDEGVAERVGFGAGVLGGDYYDLHIFFSPEFN